MKRLIGIAVLIGVGVALALVARFGLSAVIQALAALGWTGFLLVVVFHLGLFILMGASWWLLGRQRPEAELRNFVWGRLIRDSASEALPFSQLGGYVLGARALTLSGVSARFAVASTVVDISLELIAQCLYALLGVALLFRLEPRNHLVIPILAGLLAMSVLAGGFLVIQARGFGVLERMGAALGARWLAGRAHLVQELEREIRAIHDHRLMLGLCLLGHFFCWLGNGVEAWLTLRWMNVHIGVAGALVIDSLLYGMRSLAFFLPGAIGLQEGGYIMLGALFGISPPAALALSFIRRGRDLAIGVPALLVWQLLEGWRAVRGVTQR